MRYIKFTLSQGEPIILTWEQAEKLLNTPTQIVKILNDKNEWTGVVINKAHIVSSCEYKENPVLEGYRSDDNYYLENYYGERRN